MQLDGRTSRRGARVYTPIERSKAWSGLVALIEDDRLKTVPQVLEELYRNDREAFDRLKPLRKRLVVPNADFASSVMALLREFPGLIRADSMSDPADPWLIAIAVRNSYTVVCNEVHSSTRKRPDGRTRIPDVCEHHKIECIDLEALVVREGLI